MIPKNQGLYLRENRTFLSQGTRRELNLIWRQAFGVEISYMSKKYTFTQLPFHYVYVSLKTEV